LWEGVKVCKGSGGLKIEVVSLIGVGKQWGGGVASCDC
jgi:hypothetical protein